MSAVIRWSLLAAVWLAACGGESTPGVQEPQQEEPPSVVTEAQMTPAMMAQYRETCPMMIEGVEVSVEETDAGVALTFTAPGDVEALRTRVRHMADMYGHHQGQRRMMWGHMSGAHAMPGHEAMGMRGPGHMGSGRPGMHRQGIGMMPVGTASYEEIAGGGRVVMTPTDAADLESLRRMATTHQARMASGQCWISGESGEPADDGT